MTQDQLLKKLKARIAESTQAATARELGLSSGYIGNVLAGRSPISSRLAAAMGYERVTVFRRMPG